MCQAPAGWLTGPTSTRLRSAHLRLETRRAGRTLRAPGCAARGPDALARLAGPLRGDFVLDTCRVGVTATPPGGIPSACSARAVLRDRHVLLVDDIYDEGLTLESLPLIAARPCADASRRWCSCVRSTPAPSPDRADLVAWMWVMSLFRLRDGLSGALATLPEIWAWTPDVRLGIIGGRVPQRFFSVAAQHWGLPASPWGPVSAPVNRTSSTG